MIKIDPFLILDKYIANRIKADKNWMGITCGATGSGKSYANLAICERYFPKFTVDNIVFSVKEFIDRFSEIDKQRRRGDVILFDESEAWNARRSMGEENVLLSNIISMMRFTNISACFTLPDLRQIDVTAARIMHSYMYVNDIDRKTCPGWQRNRTGVSFYEIVKERMPNKDSRDLRMRYPIVDVIVRNNRTGTLYEKSIKVKELWFNAPSEDLLKAYDLRKRAHFNKVMRETSATLRAREIKEKNKQMKVGVNPDEVPHIQLNPAPAAASAATNSAIATILNG